MTLNLTFQGHLRSNVMVPFDSQYVDHFFNNNIGRNPAPLRDIRLQKLTDIDFDRSRSLKVRSNAAAGLPVYDFLLVSNSKYMSISLL